MPEQGSLRLACSLHLRLRRRPDAFSDLTKLPHRHRLAERRLLDSRCLRFGAPLLAPLRARLRLGLLLARRLLRCRLAHLLLRCRLAHLLLRLLHLCLLLVPLLLWQLTVPLQLRL